jgi:ATP-dependent Clp protease protease subunit
MIHQPSSGIGYSTFKDQAIHLKEMENLKIDLYKVLAENSGKTLEEIEALCDRDNWMKADEAIQMGFLDAIVERKE